MADAAVRGEQPTPFAGLVFNPVGKVVYGVVDFFECGEYLAEPRFCLGFMKVRPYGIVEFLLPLDNGFAEF